MSFAHVFGAIQVNSEFAR